MKQTVFLSKKSLWNVPCNRGSLNRMAVLGVALCQLLLLGRAVAQDKGGALNFYVATNGNDSWSGKLANPRQDKTDGPLATLEGARDRIRGLKGDGALPAPVTVWVRGGMYFRKKSFQLEKQDSGTVDCPVIYRAYGKETPVLSGGRAIRGWQPYKGKILKAAVTDPDLKGVRFRQLFHDGKRRPMARYPNADSADPYALGWIYVAGKRPPMYKDIPGEDKCTFEYKKEDSRSWAHPEDGEVNIFPRYNWWNNIVSIKSIDREKRIITLAANCSYPIRPEDPYYVQGMFEELDAPEEWHLDVREGMLYYWPPENTDVENLVVYAPVLPNLLELAPGTANVTFRGFTIECSNGKTIHFRATTNCRLAGCVIRGVGSYRQSAVYIEGGNNNGVVGCDISHTGRDAVYMTGGSRRTLTPCGNYVENCYIHHPGVFFSWGRGIHLRGCGLRASHNLIHDCPRSGIAFVGNNILMEYNHLHHLALANEDAAGIGTGGRDWISSRGSIIRYNHIHDVVGYGRDHHGRWVRPCFAWAIYLDDNTGGVDVIGNVVERAMKGLLHLHNARDNHIENNIFIGGTQQQIQYSGWTVDGRWPRHLDTMIKGYESVKDEPAWKKMRHMDIHPNDAPFADGLIMANNIFRHNICYWTDPNSKLFQFRNVPYDHNEWDYNLYWHEGLPLSIPQKRVAVKDEWNTWRQRGKDEHSQVADPKFVDALAGDYRLQSDSPALKLGFKPIPMDRIGPYKDELRATWPIREARGAKDWLKVDWSAPKPKVAPPRNTTPFVVRKAAGEIKIDGVLSAGEWAPEKMILKQTPVRAAISGPACTARAVHDGKTLHVALTVPVPEGATVQKGASWGASDGAEICFRDLSKADSPVFVLHGFPSGELESVVDAGAPRPAAEKLKTETRFAATIQKNRWVGEWAIPFAATNIEPKAGLRLAFNIGVRRSATNEWIVWVGALGASWKLENAGFLVLQ